MPKCEHLSGEDLGPSTFEQARFDYSPLGKFLNKDLKEKEKKRITFEDAEKYGRQEWRAIKSNWISRKKLLDAIKTIKTGSKSLKTISLFRWAKKGKKYYWSWKTCLCKIWWNNF